MDSAETESTYSRLFPPLTWPRALLLAAVLLGCALSGYWFGRYWHELDQQYLAALESKQLSTMQELTDLRTELVNVRLQNSVGNQAGQVLREDLKTLRDERESLKNELVFYRSLMAPGKLIKGLQVADLELFPRGDGKFTFHLVLTQVTNQRARISGEVKVQIGGLNQADGTVEQVYSLTDLAELEAYPLPYRFRYFQDIKGVLNVPADFTPQWVEVSAERKGKKAVQRRFTWQELIPAEFAGALAG